MKLHDDVIVDRFLRVWRDGQFTPKEEDWRRSNLPEPEVVVTGPAGTTVAVEHSRIFAFVDHQYQEALLRPAANQIEGLAGLDIPNKRFEVTFRPYVLSRLEKSQRANFTTELGLWAENELPLLPVQRQPHTLSTPKFTMSGLSVTLDVVVSERQPGMKPVSVGGYPPSNSDRTAVLVEKALRDKLPKLTNANVNIRVLLLELPTLDSEWRIVKEAGALASRYPLLQLVHYLVVAKTFGSPGFIFLVFKTTDLELDEVFAVETVR